MKFVVALTLAVASLTAQSAPWNKDCVTWWGGQIPPAERTQENCPNNHSHWDTPIQGSAVASNTGSAVDNRQPLLNPSLPTTVITNSGSYVIVPNYSGGSLPRAIIRVSK